MEEAEVPEELEVLTPHSRTVLCAVDCKVLYLSLITLYVFHGLAQHRAQAHNPVCEEVVIVASVL